MSLDGWKAIFETGGVILLFLTFLFGAGALIVSKRINYLQEERLRQFDENLTEARTDLANSQIKLEQERQTRLKLQRSVLHRMIPQLGEGERRNFDSLKPFKGTRVVFEYSPEWEPGMFAGNLAPFAINSGWSMLNKSWAEPATQELADGVTVQAYVGPNGETDRSSYAADAFATFLSANGIAGVRRAPAKGGELPPNAVRVLIGQMPDPFPQTAK